MPLWNMRMLVLTSLMLFFTSGSFAKDGPGGNEGPKGGDKVILDTMEIWRLAVKMAKETRAEMFDVENSEDEKALLFFLANQDALVNDKDKEMDLDLTPIHWVDSNKHYKKCAGVVPKSVRI